MRERGYKNDVMDEVTKPVLEMLHDAGLPKAVPGLSAVNLPPTINLTVNVNIEPQEKDESLSVIFQDMSALGMFDDIEKALASLDKNYGKVDLKNSLNYNVSQFQGSLEHGYIDISAEYAMSAILVMYKMLKEAKQNAK